MQQQQQQQQPKRVRVAEGSCWPCKDRRVLCDLAKPACAKCVRTGQECAYGKVRLKWGRSGSSRTASASAPSLALTTTVLSPLDDVGEWQLSYFEGEILPLFSLSDGCRPGATWAAANPSLRQAVVAVANAHRLIKQHTSTVSYLQESVDARGIAIKSMREQLRAGFSGARSNQTFLVNVLLCILDGMVEPHANAASSHLQGGIAILNSSKDPKGTVVGQRGIRPLLYSVFATMDLSSAIISGQAPHFDFDWWRSFSGKEAWWNGLDNDRHLLTVMGSMSRMATLGHSFRTTLSLPPIEELRDIQSFLASTAQPEVKEESPDTPSTSGTPSTLGSPSTLALSFSSEDSAAVNADRIFVSAYRAAAKLYLHRALCSLPLDASSVQESIDEGLAAFAAESQLGKLGHCLIFPALIVGAHCRDPVQQAVILQSLQGSMSFLSFGSVSMIINFLHDVFALDELPEKWWDLFAPIAGCAFFF